MVWLYAPDHLPVFRDEVPFRAVGYVLKIRHIRGLLVSSGVDLSSNATLASPLEASVSDRLLRPNRIRDEY